MFQGLLILSRYKLGHTTYTKYHGTNQTIRQRGFIATKVCIHTTPIPTNSSSVSMYACLCLCVCVCVMFFGCDGRVLCEMYVMNAYIFG